MWQKKRKTVIVFFHNRYPIMVKCLNIGKNIGKPIYRYIGLVTVLNEADQCGVISKLQELDEGVFRCAVIRIQKEEQWGENTALRSSSADRSGAGWEFSQPHYLLPVCQEAGDPLTDGGGNRELCQFILKGVWDDGVKSRAEVYKQDPHISPRSVQMLQDEVQSHVDCIIHRPVCLVGKLQGLQ